MELSDEYVKRPCECFVEGQEFILQSPEQPKYFCSQAWADIRKDVVAIFFGANISWMKKEGTMITCCTNGIGPVSFLIERVE